MIDNQNNADHKIILDSNDDEYNLKSKESVGSSSRKIEKAIQSAIIQESTIFQGKQIVHNPPAHLKDFLQNYHKNK